MFQWRKEMVSYKRGHEVGSNTACALPRRAVSTLKKFVNILPPTSMRRMQLVCGCPSTNGTTCVYEKPESTTIPYLKEKIASHWNKAGGRGGREAGNNHPVRARTDSGKLLENERAASEGAKQQA